MNILAIEKKDLMHNIQKIKEHADTNGPDDNGNKVKVIVVVKSNAYGLGMKEFVQIMVEQGFDYFAVSTVEEALEFRNYGFTQKLLMLSSTSIKEDVETLVKNDVTITIGSKEAVEVVNEIVKNQNPIKAHIKIDTGFGRYGFIYNKREEMVEAISNLKNVEIEGTFTHFSNAFYDDKYTKLQFKRFIDCIEVLKMNNIKTGMLHACNSSAFIKFPEMHLNAVRVGSAFTGRLSFGVANKLELKKIAELRSKVAEIKVLPPKFNISYSNTYTTKKEQKIAIVPIGYAQGTNVTTGRDMFRPMDKLRYIIRDIKDAMKKQNIIIEIEGQKCKVLGCLGTFHIVVDITNKDIKIGDNVKIQVNPILVNSSVKREYID